MQKIITLPQIELNLENATVVELTARVGASLKGEDTLIVIETQKATAEVPCGETGYLRTFLIKDGDLVSVHDPLAVLTDDPHEAFQMPERGAAPIVTAPAASSEMISPPAAKPAAEDSERVRALPAARRRARELGVDLAMIKGSGPEGRISVEDVESQGGAGQWPGNGITPVSARRNALIAQMEAGQREIPQIAVLRFMDVSGIAARSEGTTFTSRLIYHVARAAKSHPALLTVLEDNQLKAGPADVAVAMDTASGLTAPVIRRGDEKSLAEIARALADLRKRAEENRLGREDLRDGRLAVTNLGMLGVDLFTPLVFAGQTAVLAVGRTVEVGDRSSAWFTLAVDHRVVDGAEAARFLATLQAAIRGETS